MKKIPYILIAINLFLLVFYITELIKHQTSINHIEMQKELINIYELREELRESFKAYLKDPKDKKAEAELMEKLEKIEAVLQMTKKLNRTMKRIKTGYYEK